MSKTNILKSTVIVTIIAVLSRFVGAFRDILITNNFGATVYTDAYKISASIPDIIFTIIGLAISTAFLPTLSRIKVKSGDKEMHDFANNIINILFVISIILFVFFSFFPDKIINILAKDAPIETVNIAISLTRIILINLIFLAINACFTTILQVHEDFIVPSILGLFFNLPMIIYLLVVKDYNIYGLTIANVIGNFLRVVVQVPSLRKHGFRYKFFINLKDPRVKHIIILIIPVVIGAGANSVNLVVDKSIASGLGEGSVTTLDNAQLLVNFINSMVTTAITSVIYPVLANNLCQGKKKEFLDLLSKSILYLAIFLIPITFGVFIYGKDIVKAVFLRGMYTEHAASLASMALFGYTFGILFTGLRDLLNSTLFSMGYTKITAKNGCIGVIINIILCITLSQIFGITGISVASSIAMIVTSMLLLRNIVKLEGKLELKTLFYGIIKVIASAFVMALILLILNTVLINISYIIKLIIGIFVGGAVYLLSAYLFKIEEIKEITKLVRRKG